MSTPAETRYCEATQPRPGWPSDRWRVRLERRPWLDGAYVPLPAVWTVRDETSRVRFVCSDPTLARLVADARARGMADPAWEDEPNGGLARRMECGMCYRVVTVPLGSPHRMPPHWVPGIGTHTACGARNAPIRSYYVEIR